MLTASEGSNIIMDAVQHTGVVLVHWLQENLDYNVYDPVASTVLWLSSPDFLFYVIFPFTLLLGEWTTLQYSAAFAFSNSASFILKWSLQGHRPYWWAAMDTYGAVKIRQMPGTCQSTWGNPSEDGMTGIAISLVWAPALSRLLYTRLSKKRVYAFVWMWYGFWSVILLLSKLYSATNYMHQIITGLIAGSLIGVFVLAANWREAGVIHFLSCALFFSLWAVTTYCTAYALGAGPNTAHRLAATACNTKDALQVANYASLTIGRNLGIMLGQAAIIDWSFFKIGASARGDVLSRVLAAGFSMLGAGFIGQIECASGTCWLTEGLCAMIKGFAVTVLTLAVVPRAVVAIRKLKAEETNDYDEPVELKKLL